MGVTGRDFHILIINVLFCSSTDMRSHILIGIPPDVIIGWREKQSIPYKGVETST